MIQFEGREVIYDYADLNELGLAWSISIHKSQGSEYPVVILPLLTLVPSATYLPLLIQGLR